MGKLRLEQAWATFPVLEVTLALALAYVLSTLEADLGLLVGTSSTPHRQLFPL